MCYKADALLISYYLSLITVQCFVITIILPVCCLLHGSVTKNQYDMMSTINRYTNTKHLRITPYDKYHEIDSWKTHQAVITYFLLNLQYFDIIVILVLLL